MNTNLDISRLVAAASNRLGMVLADPANCALLDTMRLAFASVPYVLDIDRMMSDMLAYPLPAHVVLSAKHAPEAIGECIRDGEKMRMPIECPFLVRHRIHLSVACRQSGVEIKSDESAAYAFYLLAYAIRLQRPTV